MVAPMRTVLTETPYAPVLADGELILIAGALLAAGMLASLVAGRLRVPGLLLFLFLGMAIGSDGLGLIDFSDYRLARRIGIIALALILFEGGLTSGLLEIRPVLTPALSLAIVGTIVTAVVTGFAAVWLFDLSTLNGHAARLGAGGDRRRGDLRAAARVDAQAPPGDDARGRVGLQRPGRDPARARLHRVAAARRLRASPTWPCSSSASSASASRSASWWGSPPRGRCGA